MAFLISQIEYWSDENIPWSTYTYSTFLVANFFAVQEKKKISTKNA